MKDLQLIKNKMKELEKSILDYTQGDPAFVVKLKDDLFFKRSTIIKIEKEYVRKMYLGHEYFDEVFTNSFIEKYDQLSSNFVKIKEVNREEKFISMEFVDGHIVSIQDIVEFHFEQLIGILKEMATHRILHTDMSQGNFMLSKGKLILIDPDSFIETKTNKKLLNLIQDMMSSKSSSEKIKILKSTHLREGNTF